MPQFNRDNVKELKKFLYNSYVHDAIIDRIEYETKEGILKIQLVNPLYNIRYNISFLKIDIVMGTKGNAFGSRETILALVVEDDYSYLQNYLSEQYKYDNDSLYLVFQMFSGDELHIVAKDMMLETA